MGPMGDIPMVPWLSMVDVFFLFLYSQRVEEFENFERSFIQLLAVL